MPKCNKKILKRLKQKKKGFTLLEIVVALAVIGIMMIPLGGALLTSVKANKMGEIKQEAKLISQEIIEKLRSIGKVENGPMSVGGMSNNINLQEVITNNEEFRIVGNINGINIKNSSKIEKTHKLIVESDTNSKKIVDLFIYIDNGEIKYSDSAKTIEEHINDTNGLVSVRDKNLLNLTIEKDNSAKFNGNTVNISNSIAIFVTEKRTKGLISLNLINKSTKMIDVFIYGNKFDEETDSDKTTDSFDKDRVIKGDFKIRDNLKYSKKNEEKGLYQITLDLEKTIPNGGTVTEQTISEFMIDK